MSLIVEVAIDVAKDMRRKGESYAWGVREARRRVRAPVEVVARAQGRLDGMVVKAGPLPPGKDGGR